MCPLLLALSGNTAATAVCAYTHTMLVLQNQLSDYSNAPEHQLSFTNTDQSGILTVFCSGVKSDNINFDFSRSIPTYKAIVLLQCKQYLVFFAFQIY